MHFRSTFLFNPIRLTVALLLLASAVEAQDAKQEKVTYEDHVKPIFRQHCFSCHNQNKKEGDLDLTNYTSLIQGGGSGAVIEPGSVDDSYLFALVNHDDEPSMPPEQPKIADAKVAVLSKWIELGALENNSSKAKLKKKKSFDFALSDPAVGKPAVMPLPSRLDLEPVIHTDRSTGVTALATSPWAPLVAIAGQKQVVLVDTKTRELKGILPFPEGVVSVLRFSRNGALLLAGGGRGGASGKVVVWNIKNGERIIEVGDELDTVLAADISSDQKLVALGGPQKLVRVYSTEDNSLVYEIKKHTDWVTSLEFSPDGVLLASGDRNGGVHVWEAFSGRAYLTLKAHNQAITGISWRTDSNIVATTSEDASIRLWEMNNGRSVKNWTAHGGGSLAVEFTRDGRLVSGGRDKYAKIWDQNGKQLFRFPAFADIVMQVTHCDESNTVVAGDWTGEIRQFNAVDGKQISLLTSNPQPLADQLTTAQQTLATATAEAKKLSEAAANSKAVVDKMNASLTMAKKQTTDLTATIKMLKAKGVADQKTMETMTKQASDLKARVGLLNGAVPELKKATQNAAAAVAKIPADNELKKLAADLNKVLAARQAELKTRSSEMAAAEQKIAALATTQKTDKTRLEQSDAALKAAEQQVATLTPKIKPAAEKYAQDKTAADQAQAAVAKAASAVQRWTEAIAFSEQLRELKSKVAAESEQLEMLEIAMVEAEEKAAVATQDLAKAKGLQAETQAQLATKKAEVVKLQTAGNQYQQAMKSIQGEIVSLTDSLTQTQAAIPLLKEAQTKLEAAKAATPENADVTAAAEGLLGLIEKETAKAVSIQMSVKEKNTKLAALEGELAKNVAATASAQQTVKDLESKLVAEQKMVAEKQKAVDAATAKVAKASQEVDKKTSEIEGLRNQIADLQDPANET